MGARRTAEIVLVLPAILTLGFALRPKPVVDPFDFLSDPELDRRIEAYRPLVIATESQRWPSGRIDPGHLTRLAKAWVAESEAGRLKPLRPLVLSESIYEGTTGQILRTQQSLANSVITRGEEKIQSGKARAGAEDILLGLRVYRPTKYSDFQSATLIGLQVRRAITWLRLAARSMSEDDRRWMFREAKRLGPDRRRLAELGLTMRRLYEERLWRQGRLVEDELNLGRLVALRSARDGEPTASIEQVRAEIAKEHRKSRELAPLVEGLNRVLESEMSTERRLRDLIEMKEFPEPLSASWERGAYDAGPLLDVSRADPKRRPFKGEIPYRRAQDLLDRQLDRIVIRPPSR